MTTDQSETFGERLRRSRRSRGMTQRELAERVSIDPTYLCKIETDRLPAPADSTITRLGDALGLEPRDLFAVARKVPRGIGKLVSVAPPEMAMLIREILRNPPTEQQYQQIWDVLRGREQETA